MSNLILIVDDERDLVNTLEYNLQKEGYKTRVALTGVAALDMAALDPTPDMIILDLMMPDLSGVEVCRRLRLAERTRHIPILILSAKGEEIDRVVGFEVGADDYVVKPFSTRELLLRVRAIIRRRTSEEGEPEELLFGVLKINVPAHQVWTGSEEVHLSALEFRLLTTLLHRKGRVQTREVLLDDVWGIEADITTRTVDTHVKRLREKIGAAAGYIETIRGVGYRFRGQPEEGPS